MRENYPRFSLITSGETALVTDQHYYYIYVESYSYCYSNNLIPS